MAVLIEPAPTTAAPPRDPGGDHLWRGVDRLVDRGALPGLRAHRLQLLAAQRWRILGRPVPEGVRAEERAAAIVSLLAPIVLERVRAGCDGPIALIKGPAAAARYPDPALRPFRDLDILVPDAAAVQSALVASGFEPVGHDDAYYDARHHLRPLALPGTPLVVEVHRRPEWPKWGAAPAAEELLAAAGPAGFGVDGILALDPAHHALVLAAHSWSQRPLRRLLDLVDVSALAGDAPRERIAAVADGWGIGGVWDTTIAAADALLFGRPLPRSLRIWARDLPQVRDGTVLENHLGRLLSPFWVVPPPRATRLAAAAFAREVQPAPGETWRSKRARILHAARNPLRRLSEHHT